MCFVVDWSFKYIAQRFAALHGCELRNRDLSAKIIFIAKRKHDFTINLEIMQNGC